MRIPQLVLAVAGTLMCTGCSELISLHPFVSDKEAVQDARLLGVWVDEDDTYLGCQIDHIISEKHGGATTSQAYSK